jgi:hypothetical protein
MWVVFQLIALLSVGVPFLIFLDYNKKRDIHKGVLFVVLFFVAVFILSILIAVFRFGILWGLPFLAAFPFLLVFIGKKKD